jgi:hypothetical protein
VGCLYHIDIRLKDIHHFAMSIILILLLSSETDKKLQWQIFISVASYNLYTPLSEAFSCSSAERVKKKMASNA